MFTKSLGFNVVEMLSQGGFQSNVYSSMTDISYIVVCALCTLNQRFIHLNDFKSLDTIGGTLEGLKI